MDKIMVVDDEKDIVYLIKDFMRIHQIDVVEAFSGEDAVKKLDPSLKAIILDINMEKSSGLETCKRIREAGLYIPIIFLTAKASPSDKVLGLGIGGDDYMTKPFDPIELVSRVKAHIRRNEEYNRRETEPALKELICGDLTVYPDKYQVLKAGQQIHLSSKEFELLIYFIKNLNIVLSREKILDNIWSNSQYDYTVVTTNIKRLRKKIEEDPDNPRYIKTIRGVGYVLQEIKASE